MTEGGIWIPPNDKSEGHVGRVIAVCGPYWEGETERVANYKVGDLVVFGRFTGTEVRVGRIDKCIVLDEKSILCEIDEELLNAPD